MTTIGKSLLFFTSWCPAYLMIGLISLDHQVYLALGAFALSIISVGVYFLMEGLLFQRAPRSITVREISRRDENVLMYIIAYLPPFFALDPTNGGQLSALALFYVIFSVTYVKLGLYYLNPMFIFRSYRTFDLVSESGQKYIALIKSPLTPEAGETISYRGRDQIIIVTGEAKQSAS